MTILNTKQQCIWNAAIDYIKSDYSGWERITAKYGLSEDEIERMNTLSSSHP